MQSSAAKGTAVDVETILHRFPKDPETGKGPRLERGAVEINGVGVGPSAAARSALTMKKVELVDERIKLLEFTTRRASGCRLPSSMAACASRRAQR